MAQSILKQTAERKTVGVDYSPVLATGETLIIGNISVTATDVLTGTDYTSTVIQAGTETVSGSQILFRVIGGVDGTTYKIIVNTGLTSSNNIHEEDVILVVNDDIQLLATVDEVKRSLGITSTDDDVLMFDLVKSSSDFVEKSANRTFNFASYTETFYPETGVRELLLENFPITSVTSVVIDGITLDLATSTIRNYVWSKDGTLRRVDGGIFPREPAETVVTYKAGFETVPEDVRHAVRKMVSREYLRRLKEGIASESLGTYEVKFGAGFSEDGDEMVKGVIQRYRKRPL
jgi:hypothetical protein